MSDLSYLTPAEKGYIKFRHRASREKFYAAYFATGKYHRYARKKHDTATRALSYCRDVVNRYERLRSVPKPTLWQRILLFLESIRRRLLRS